MKANVRASLVAPYVGAWIETPLGAYAGKGVGSHPTWVRGLKLDPSFDDAAQVLSHPTWVRGLKQVKKSNAKRHRQSHPTWVRGLKLYLSLTRQKISCRTLRGCVD